LWGQAIQSISGSLSVLKDRIPKRFDLFQQEDGVFGLRQTV